MKPAIGAPDPPDPPAAAGRESGAREALARLYDLDLVDDPGDLDLYLALAGRTGGPILELGRRERSPGRAARRWRATP